VTNEAQNTGTAKNAVSSTNPSAPDGPELLTSCPLFCTVIRVPCICQAPEPSRMAIISEQSAR